jgi:carbamoyltransferase
MLREGRVLDPTLPAVTHADGTCRLQTVAREDDPRFFDLLACFGERTGAPVLVNTSMNVAGMPIAETPRDAIETLLRTELDALVIGDFLVRKR